MSTIIMARCWPMRLPAVPKSVLISLADQANDQGVCWPSVQTISERTCYSDRAVQKALRWLQDMGLLDVEVGAMRANRYTLRPDRYKPEHGEIHDSTPEPRSPVNDVHPRTTFTPPPNHVHPNRNRTISNTPPIPPKGGEAAMGYEGNENSEKPGPITLRQWLERCRLAGVKPIPADDPIWSYCERVGISDDFLTLHWREFKRRYELRNKRYTDWRRTLRNSVEGNWYKLWHIGGDGVCRLTTQGIQAKRAAGDRE